MTWHQRFFWLLMVLLPTQLGYHFWPQWAMVLGRRVDYLSPTLYLTDILLILTLVCWLPGEELKIKKQKLLMPLLAILFIGWNILQATNPLVAMYKWLKVAELLLLGWYIVRTRPTLPTVVAPLSFGVFYSSLLAIVQFVLQRSVGGPLWWLGERTFDVTTPGIARTVWYGRELLRPYATFPHPNVLGGYIAAVLPSVIIQLSNNPIIKLSNSKKFFYLTIFTLGLMALLLTFSRSAIVVGTVGIGISIWYLVFRKKPYRIFSYILYTTPFILFLIAVVWSFSPQEESVVVRGQLNTAAVKLWTSSPLFGVGLGNFLVRLPEVIPTRTIYFLQPVHNIYLLMLSEIGILGIGLIVLWALAQSQKYKVQRTKRKKKNSLCTYHFALLTFLLLGLVDHYPLTLQQGQILLTILAAGSLAWVH